MIKRSFLSHQKLLMIDRYGLPTKKELRHLRELFGNLYAGSALDLLENPEDQELFAKVVMFATFGYHINLVDNNCDANSFYVLDTGDIMHLINEIALDYYGAPIDIEETDAWLDEEGDGDMIDVDEYRHDCKKNFPKVCRQYDKLCFMKDCQRE